MADISTKYMGLNLKNPLIIGSCGLTANIKSLQQFDKAGAAAVVLKSVFEEEINLEYDKLLQEAGNLGYKNEDLDYFDYKIKEENLNEYINLIVEAKSKLSIPVIASINCISEHEWANFAKRCENAGADGLEVNIAFFPSDFTLKPEEIESRYFNIVNQLIKKIDIPVALKIGPWFTNTGSMIRRLSATGVRSLVLFNRFYNPDFDIETLKLTSKNIFSSPNESSLPLRFIAMMFNRVNCDLAASTGIHNGEDMVKQILAGASAVQIVSVLYEESGQVIGKMLGFLNNWMDKKGFSNLQDFKGKLSQDQGSNPAAYERVQFMKFFSGKF